MDTVEIITAITVALNTLWIIWSSWQKNKPEVKKLELEGDSELVEAANANLAGAQISGQMLLSRINELKEDLEFEKRARKSDAEYLRRRLMEAEHEARDYRLWASKLAKQVIGAGLIPEPFISSMFDPEQENKKSSYSAEQIDTQQKKEQADVDRKN